MGRSAAWVLMVCAVVSPARLHGQGYRFEAASIRLNTSWPVTEIAPSIRGGFFSGQGVPLQHLIAMAYGLSGPRILGPDWLEKDRYDIGARAPEGVPDSELKPMLQALLRDRFGLTAHTEAREMAVYELIISPGGVKMTSNIADQPKPKYKQSSGLTLSAQRMTMPRLTDILSLLTGRAVIDKTGLTGTFAISFQATSSVETQAGMVDPGDAPPDVFTAVQEQLGLKLRAAEDSLDALMIDHIERVPKEN